MPRRVNFLPEIEAALSPATRDRVLAHPAFRSTAEALAAEGLSHTYAQDEHTTWLTKDIGRTALYIATLMLEAVMGKVSTYDILASANLNATCSRGRVLAWVDYARKNGRLEVPPGEGHWTKRPLRLSETFIDFARSRTWRELQAASAVLPEAWAALALRDDPRAFRVVLMAGAQAHLAQREVFRSVEEGLQPFMAREAGMRVLNELVGRQKPERSRFMETASFSRRELARKLSISRVHINTLLTDAASQGLLSFTAPDAVAFSPELSTRAAQHFAFRMQMASLYACAMLQVCGADDAPRPVSTAETTI